MFKKISILVVFSLIFGAVSFNAQTYTPCIATPTTTTINIGLNLPGNCVLNYGTLLNTNFVTLDSAIYALQVEELGKAPAFTVSTTGNSGSASYSGNIINIPQYQSALGYTPVNNAGDTMSGTLTVPNIILGPALTFSVSTPFQLRQDANTSTGLNIQNASLGTGASVSYATGINGTISGAGQTNFGLFGQNGLNAVSSSSYTIGSSGDVFVLGKGENVVIGTPNGDTTHSVLIMPNNSLSASFLGNGQIKFPLISASSGNFCLQIDTSGNVTNTGSACGSSGVTTSGSPASGNIAVFSGSSAITNATSGNIQAAIGAGVYDASGAAAFAQAASVSALTTINGHSLSGSVVISASDLTTGTLPHAQLPALVSGDIPSNAANTTGTAANVTGTVVVANGGTGATTAAGANLNITGVTQTGTLGTSSQVSTFPGTVAAGATMSAPNVTISGTPTNPTDADTLGAVTTAVGVETTRAEGAEGSLTTAVGGKANAGASTTVNGQTCTLGSTCTVTSTATNALTMNNSGSGATSGTTFNGSAAQTISYNTIGAPSTTGANASGTWGISITGNAATATNVAYTGLTGTVPTWNQSTTGNAATATTATSVPYGGLTGTVPTWNQSTTGNAANVTGTVAIGNGGTGATTAAGANLNITGVTQTGTLGTSSQVSTFPGTVAAGATSPVGVTGLWGVASQGEVNGAAYSTPAAAIVAACTSSKAVYFPAGVYTSGLPITCSDLHVRCASRDTIASGGTIFRITGANWGLYNPNADLTSGSNNVRSITIQGCGFDISTDPTNVLGAWRIKGISASTFIGNNIYADSNANPAVTEDGSNYNYNGGDYDNDFISDTLYDNASPSVPLGGSTGIGIYVTACSTFTGCAGQTVAGSNDNHHFGGGISRFGTSVTIDGGNNNSFIATDGENPEQNCLTLSAVGSQSAFGNLFQRFRCETDIPPWSSGAKTVGAKIIDANNNYETVSAAGTTGASAPAWGTTLGATTTDGTVTWTLTQIAPVLVSATGTQKNYIDVYGSGYTTFANDTTAQNNYSASTIFGPGVGRQQIAGGASDTGKYGWNQYGVAKQPAFADNGIYNAGLDVHGTIQSDRMLILCQFTNGCYTLGVQLVIGATSGSGTGASLVVSSVANGQIAGITIASGGTGYAVGDTLSSLTQLSSSGAGAVLTVASATSGAITGLTITNGGGGGYTIFKSLATMARTFTLPDANSSTVAGLSSAPAGGYISYIDTSGIQWQGNGSLSVDVVTSPSISVGTASVSGSTGGVFSVGTGRVNGSSGSPVFGTLNFNGGNTGAVRDEIQCADISISQLYSYCNWMIGTDISSADTLRNALKMTGNGTGTTVVAVQDALTTPSITTGATGTAVVKMAQYSASITPSAVSASTCVEQTFTFTGVNASDHVTSFNPPSAMSHVWIGSMRASATNTIAVEFCGDLTGGTPPSGTWYVTVQQ